MSFLKQLLTPFVEFDEDQKKDQAKENKSATAASVPVATPASSNLKADAPDPNAHHPLIDSTPGVTSSAGQIPTYSPAGTITGPLPEHAQYFEKLIDNANATDPIFQGTDYKEFVDSKVDIDDIQDEAIKYRTAFNVLKSTGLTREKLLSTGQEYLNLIGRDMNAFQGAHALKYQKEVRQKEQQIQKKAEELQALTQRINALKTEINQLTQDINLTKDSLTTIKNSYLLAGENKQKEIETELQKIGRYF
jgi:uncharacterized protein YukE